MTFAIAPSSSTTTVFDLTSPVGPLPYIPDDLTCTQFLLDHRHPARPYNKFSNPWLVEEATGRQVGCEEARARAWGLANALSSRWKIGEDDVVCVFSANHIDWPIAIWATHRLGGIVTGANPAYTPDELSYQLNITRTKLLITHSSSLSVALAAARNSGIPEDHIVLIDSQPIAAGSKLYPTVETLVQEGLKIAPTFVERRLAPGEGRTKLALLNFSSGTTGTPKAVAIPHYAVIANTIQMAFHDRAAEDYTTWEKRRTRTGDAVYAVLPMYHVYGILITLQHYIFVGYTLVISSKFNLVNMLKSIERYRINHLLTAPPMVVQMCKNPVVKQYDLSSVRFMMCSAAPLSAELTQQLIELLPQIEIHQGYGMTETSSVVTWPRTDKKYGSLGSGGQIMPGVTMRVVKEDGTLAKLGESGELYVKTPAMALGYFNNEEATRETFINGWVRTGDIVYFNDEGEVFVIDRIKELMKVKGFQVAPAELEGHLFTNPLVGDTCVVPIPDEYSGEVPLAFVVPSKTALDRVKKCPEEADTIKAEIVKFVADNKVYYKRLAGGVEFIDAIPRNPSGKLLRRVLREKARELKKAQAATQTKAKL
ncbi:unnamed protein product [Somion occarium]|uniref:Uncharacterized protein n=1 Tax=Somion occarium TaxID=3059160 RepID=A0ABP1CHJ6_9APHY